MALIIVAVIALGLAALAFVLASQVTALRSRVGDAGAALGEASARVTALRDQESLWKERAAALEAENRKRAGWIDHQEKEIAWLRQELETRPKVTRRTYKILTLGASGSGKTALTLKWANPLVDLGTLQGSKIERYERVVSRTTHQDLTVEHVFQIGDWGGEFVVDAQHELVMDEVHGLLMVVDLARKGTSALDTERIQQQLCDFQPQTLRFFFGPNMSASCKTVVLFINKSDALTGSPAEIERQARAHYERLIADLDAFKSQLDVRVFVGSAQYGTSTHELFAHFVERILPKSAYDPQLLQQLKGAIEPEGAAVPGAPIGLPAAPSPTTETLPRVGPGVAAAAAKRVPPLPGRSAHVVRK